MGTGFAANRRLTALDVHEIRQFWDEGWFGFHHNGDAIALTYGIRTATARNVGSRDSWYWLPERDEKGG